MISFKNIDNIRNPEALSRTSDHVYSLDEFSRRMSTGKKLRIKYGVDVTAPFLHIGHAVNLWMMRELQEQGHTLVFLIGDYTTRIGDPTGRSDTRPIIPREQIEKNALEFISQISTVVLTDPSVFEVRRNSEWWEDMPLSEFIGLLSMLTHARLIGRDMFQRRIEEQKEIYLHEMVYPLLQGYDSVMLKADLTIVGSDQLFNENLGRFFQEKFGQNPQVIITSRITPGLDGKAKQSKSLNNYIAITDSPREKYGKSMSIPDQLIVPYLEVYTDVPLSVIEEVKAGIDSGRNPVNYKKFFAEKLVERYHGAPSAATEREWFEHTFSRRDEVTDVVEIVLPPFGSVVELVHACRPATSKSEARRLVAQGGVTLAGRKVSEIDNGDFSDGDIIKLGKKSWFRLKKA